MIRLSVSQERSICTEGEKSYPNECCGMLLGILSDDNKRDVTCILPIVNARETEEQYHRFVIEPEDFMRAEIEARKRGLDVLGFYHSHPDHQSIPSDYDREHALPFYSYIIVEVRKGKAVTLTSWELSTDRLQFTQENVQNIP